MLPRRRPPEKDRAPRATRLSPTGRSGGPAAGPAHDAARRGPARPRRPRAGGRWRRRGRRLVRGRREPSTRSRTRSRNAPTSASDARFVHRSAGPGGEDGGRVSGNGGRDEQHARRIRLLAVGGRDPVERRDPLAASLDERRAPAEEERDIAPEARARVRRRCSGSRAAPQASRAPASAAAASLEPPARPAATGIRLSRRIARGGAAVPAALTALRAALTALRTRLSAAGPGSKPVEWRLSAAVGLDCNAQPIGEAERHHDRVERVVAVGTPADDRQGQVELGRCEPHDGSQATHRVGHAR